MSLCFAAKAGADTLCLALPDEAGDVVSAALALAGHEPLLAALEAWLQQPLDPRPVPHVDFGGPLLWAESSAVQIGLPWSLLAAQAQGPAWPMRWPELEFEVDVADFDGPPMPAQARAGVLLLPPAFEAVWRLGLHERQHGLRAEAEWGGPGSELLLCAAPEPGASVRAPWRVQLDTTFRRPLPELLGWEPAAMPWRPEGRACLHGPAGPGPAGRIAPALTGAGLWLEA